MVVSRRQFHVVLNLFLFGVLLLAQVGKAGSIRPIGDEETAKLPCLEEEGAAAACSMPLKPGTLWRQLAILVGASLAKFEFKTILAGASLAKLEFKTCQSNNQD